MTRPVVMDADGLVDADLRPWCGCVVPVPSRQLAGGAVVVFPRPRVRCDDAGRPVAVELDLMAWLVSIAAGMTLPLVCDSQQAARAAGEAFAGYVADGRVDPRAAGQIADWCRWWSERTADAAVIDGGSL